MKKLIFIVLLSILMAGCGVKKKITHTETYDSIATTKDSIRTEYVETVRDTTIYLSSDSALISALLECDSLGHVHIKTIIDLESGLRIKPKIKLVDNIITLKCSQEDSIAISVYWKDIYEKQYKEYIANTQVESTVEDEKIIVRSPWYLRFWYIWIVPIVIILYIAKRLKFF